MPPSNYRTDIQGLRAIAVLAVMLFHANQNWLPGGFLGVDIFFVISGYVVSLSILKPDRKFSWITFYLNRIKRITPAYYTLLLATTLCAAILFLPNDYNIYNESLKTALYFNSNSYFKSFGDYFAPNSNELPLLHTWSLAVEMKFYLLLPLLLILIPKKYLPYIFILTITILCIYSQQMSNTSNTLYYSFLPRITEFLFGSILVLIPPLNHNLLKQVLAILGIALISIAFIVIPHQNYPSILIILPSIGTALLIYTPDSYFSKTLSFPILITIGTLSYSLYLWHWPIFALTRYYLQQYSLSLITIVTCFAISLLSAYLSYTLLEKKISTLANKSAITVSLLLTLLTFSSIFLGSKINSFLAPKISVEEQRYADPKFICHGQIIDQCHKGAKKEHADILVIGDSHTAQLNHFYDFIGKRANITFKVISGSSCIPIPNFNIDKLPYWAQKKCLQQINIVKNELKNYNLVIIGAYWQWQLDDQQTKIELINFIESLPNKTFLIMSQLPVYNKNVIRSLHFRDIGLSSSYQHTKDWQTNNNFFKKYATNNTNVIFFDISYQKFLQSPIWNNQLIYHDQHHLNEIGAKIYAEEAYPLFSKILKLKYQKDL